MLILIKPKFHCIYEQRDSNTYSLGWFSVELPTHPLDKMRNCGW